MQTLSGEKNENNLLRRAFCIGHWPLAFGGWPFAPIPLNMCFVVHACAGHWPVDIVRHLAGKLPQCSWPLEMALDVNAWPYVCWMVMCDPMVGHVALGSELQWSLSALPWRRWQAWQRPGASTRTTTHCPRFKSTGGNGSVSMASRPSAGPSEGFLELLQRHWKISCAVAMPCRSRQRYCQLA